MKKITCYHGDSHQALGFSKSNVERSLTNRIYVWGGDLTLLKMNDLQLCLNFAPPSEPANSVCKVGQTCCSVQAQKSLQERVTTNYTRNISTIMSTHMSICLNNNFTGEKGDICPSPKERGVWKVWARE